MPFLKTDPSAPAATLRQEILRERIAWMHRNRSDFLLLIVSIAAMVLNLLLNADNLGLTIVLSFGVGFVSAVAILAAVIDPPGVYAKRMGLVGEVNTATALKSLELEGWGVTHDRFTKYSNIDHVVVGGAGVFVIESKNLSGVIKPSRTHARQVRSEAFAVSAHLKSFKRGVPWVHGIVVYWGEFPQGVVEGDRMTYVAGERLADWLRARPAKHDVDWVQGVAALVNAMPANSADLAQAARSVAKRS